MMRKIWSIIVGYLIFVASSLALFNLSGQAPHAQATTKFIIFTAIYGMLFSVVSGLTTQIVAKTKNLTINYVLALIIAGFAIFSFFKADGSHWSQVLAIFIFAPVSILGGLAYIKRFNK